VGLQGAVGDAAGRDVAAALNGLLRSGSSSANTTRVMVDGAIGGPDVGDRVPPRYDECLGW
jgi:hypothetical protein